MDADRSGFVDLLELKSLVEDASHNVRLKAAVRVGGAGRVGGVWEVSV